MLCNFTAEAIKFNEMSIPAQKTITISLSILGAAAVILGAFGAHGLEEHLTVDQEKSYETAVIYHLAHVLAGLYAISVVKEDNRWAQLSALFFILGILLFSGSLYFLSTAHLTSIPLAWIGPITPIGGLFLILGWLSLALHYFKS
jgi:uncharacterized membrane protein YgdD (TMEM256/DUF423 family)